MSTMPTGRHVRRRPRIDLAAEAEGLWMVLGVMLLLAVVVTLVL
jgi:hypothetical protein